jgi:3-deoxy-D-manno-octulosonic-acid transferase
LVLNARLSDKSFAKYLFFKGFIKAIASDIKMFCVQSELDAKRFSEIGIDEDKIKITGNMKFDSIEELSSKKPTDLDSLKDKIGLRGNDFLIVAGSTHKGEEEHILDIYIHLKRQFDNLRLLIAPRHLERTIDIENIIEKRGVRAKRLSESEKSSGDEVFILDTIGELCLVYGLADFVFVGGSLVPAGGHNILEPAFFAKPIIVGPYMHNFREITQIFLSNSALIQVKDTHDLDLKIKELISDKDKLSKLGSAAKSVLFSRQGATVTNLEIIEKTMR